MLNWKVDRQRGGMGFKVEFCQLTCMAEYQPWPLPNRVPHFYTFNPLVYQPIAPVDLDNLADCRDGQS